MSVFDRKCVKLMSNGALDTYDGMKDISCSTLFLKAFPIDKNHEKFDGTGISMKNAVNHCLFMFFLPFPCHSHYWIHI